MTHRPLYTHVRGRVIVACSCGFLSKKARYADPADVHDRHATAARLIDLQALFRSSALN